MTSKRTSHPWRLAGGILLIVAGLAAYASRLALEKEFPVLAEFPFVTIAAAGLLLGGSALLVAARSRPSGSDDEGGA